jgi:hypothetical protein
MVTIDEAERMMNLLLILADVAEEARLSPSAFRKWASGWLWHEFPNGYLPPLVHTHLYKNKQSPRWFARFGVWRDTNEGGALGLECQSPRFDILIFHDGKMV